MSSPPPVDIEEHECNTNAFHNTIKDDTDEGACFDPMYTLGSIETCYKMGMMSCCAPSIWDYRVIE